MLLLRNKTSVLLSMSTTPRHDDGIAKRKSSFQDLPFASWRNSTDKMILIFISMRAVICWTVHVVGKIECPVRIHLIEVESSGVNEPTDVIPLGFIANRLIGIDRAGWQAFTRHLIIVKGNADLHQIVLALRASPLQRLLHGRSNSQQ